MHPLVKLTTFRVVTILIFPCPYYQDKHENIKGGEAGEEEESFHRSLLWEFIVYLVLIGNENRSSLPHAE